MRLQMQPQELRCAKCRGPYPLRGWDWQETQVVHAAELLVPCLVTQQHLCGLAFR